MDVMGCAFCCETTHALCRVNQPKLTKVCNNGDGDSVVDRHDLTVDGVIYTYSLLSIQAISIGVKIHGDGENRFLGSKLKECVFAALSCRVIYPTFRD